MHAHKYMLTHNHPPTHPPTHTHIRPPTHTYTRTYTHRDPTHGVTGAISLEGPKEHDLQLTRELEQFLRDNDVFESAKEEELRYVSLSSVCVCVCVCVFVGVWVWVWLDGWVWACRCGCVGVGVYRCW